MTNEVRILVCKILQKDKAPANMSDTSALTQNYRETNHSPALAASIVVTNLSWERLAVLRLNIGMESLIMFLGV